MVFQTLLLRLLVTCTLVAACPSAASAATPSAGLGVNGQALLWLPASSWPTHLTEMQRDGIRVVRTDASWQGIQPVAPTAVQNGYRWGFTDALVYALAEHHLRWLPMAGYSTLWAVPRSLLSGPNQYLPPAEPSQYAAFAGALAHRYGPHGTFWQAHPSLPRMPVTAIEIWNEENGNFFWRPASDPARYAQLYEAARAAIHADGRGVEAIVGGLASPGEQFLEQLYLALGERRGMFDAVGVHPYAANPAEVGDEVARIRSILDAHGDVDTQIDVTEFGWTTSGFPLQQHASDRQRAAMLAQATALLADSNCGVERILPYTWATRELDPANAEDWYGIVSPDGAPTLSATAYADELHSLERTPAPRATIRLWPRR
jgi:polysaccharide biosynthesis protein PslG